MGTLPNHGAGRRRKGFVKGQADHVDAWLMSYADMITLLFMFFVILVSASVTQQRQSAPKPGEPPHPYLDKHSGLMDLGTPYDKMYRSLIGTVMSNNADQNIGVQRMQHGLWLELSSLQFFGRGDADIPAAQLPLLQSIARNIKSGVFPGDRVEVESYTDDAHARNSPYANNWELSAMRAARVAHVLIEAGVDPEQIRVVSYAGTHPLVPNIDAAGIPIVANRQRNQRVVIRIEQAQPDKKP